MKKDTRKNKKKVDALYEKIWELQSRFIAQVNPTEDEKEQLYSELTEVWGRNENADEFLAAADIFYTLRDPEWEA